MRCSRPMDEGDEGRSSRGKGRSEGEGRPENDGRSNSGRGRSEGEGRSENDARSNRGRGRSEGEGRSENDGRSNRGRGRSEGEGRSPEGRSQEDQGRPRKHTLRDVAAEAGVSIGTASNAFNRPDLLSEGLRDRVF